MKCKSLLLVALVVCAVQARGTNVEEHSAGRRIATPGVVSLPWDALPTDSQDCRLVGSYPNPSGVRHGVGDVVGNHVYMAAGDSGMDILDVSDMDNITKVGHLAVTGDGHEVVGIDVVGTLAYLAAGIYIDVVDVSNPASPSIIGQVLSGGWAKYIEVRGDYAYVGDYSNGLRIADVSDPEKPVKVGYCPAFGAGSTVLIGNFAYVGCAWEDSLDGLRIIDVSNPAAPVESSYLRLVTSEAVDVLDSTHIFVADGTWMRIIDVSNSRAPVDIEDYDNEGWAYGVSVHSPFVYVACQTWGLRVMNAADPANLVPVGHWDTDTASMERCIRYGRYVYTSDYYAGLQIIEFSGDTTGYGCEEGRRPPVRSQQLTATIARGVLFLSEDRGPKTEDRVALVDAAGRRVVELHPGPNYVQHLSPGVYFVSSPKSVEKVLLTR